MRTTKVDVNALQSLLKQQKIATLGELKVALGTEAQATVFRKLSELGYRTSYSHSGHYYALNAVIRFNSQGLWSFDAVRFSRYGTLLATLENIIVNSEDGYFSAELKEHLYVEVKTPLLKLFNNSRVTRKKIQGQYLYCSVDPDICRRQILNRQAKSAYDGTRSIIMGDDWVSDEVKAAIIIFVSILDEKQRRLFAGLESLQFGHGGDNWIADLLCLDPHTVSKGRRQLLERDIMLQGIREKGAGRPEVKKTLQK